MSLKKLFTVGCGISLINGATLASPALGADPIVTLNIRGKEKIQTRRSELTQRSRWFNGILDGGFQTYDVEKPLFIDDPPEVFLPIFRWIRDESLPKKDDPIWEDEGALDLFYKRAEFYCPDSFDELKWRVEKKRFGMVDKVAGKWTYSLKGNSGVQRLNLDLKPLPGKEKKEEEDAGKSSGFYAQTFIANPTSLFHIVDKICAWYSETAIASEEGDAILDKPLMGNTVRNRLLFVTAEEDVNADLFTTFVVSSRITHFLFTIEVVNGALQLHWHEVDRPDRDPAGRPQAEPTTVATYLEVFARETSSLEERVAQSNALRRYITEGEPTFKPEITLRRVGL